MLGELPRVGIGVDVHPFESGRLCWVAGLLWPGVDGLGLTGRGEGLAAIATALVVPR